MNVSRQSFHVGVFEVDPRLLRIYGPDAETRVEPKVMEVLVLLAERSGDVVSRRELLDRVWSGTVVTEDVVNRSISELRKAFGDDAHDPTFIETVPKRGYRLVAPLSGIDEQGGPGRTTAGRVWIAAGTALLLVVFLTWWVQRRDSDSDPRVYHAEPLTTYPGPEGPPRLSPDGQQVAFAWRGEDDTDLDIYIRLVNRGPVVRLTQDPGMDHAPTWSPDGTQIAYIHRDSACTIKLVSSLGGAPRNVASCGLNLYGDLMWSPRGSVVAFTDRSLEEGPFAIVTVDLESGERHVVTAPPGGVWGDHDPRFSPDASRLAFTRSFSEGMQDLFVVELASGRTEQLTDDRRNIWGSDWIDGNTIVFASNRSGVMSLWRLKPDDGDLEWISLSTYPAVFPDVSNGRLAFGTDRSETNIWEFDLTGGRDALPVIESTRSDLHPDIAPDGSLAFVSNRGGSYEVWVKREGDRNPIQITDFGGPFTSTPRWSPDGRAIVFVGRADGAADIYIVAPDGSNLRQVTADSYGQLNPAWSPDGQSLYYTSNETGQWQIWRQHLETGPRERLTEDGGFLSQPHPDGKTFYYSKVTEPGLWLKTATASAPSQLITDLDLRDWGNWIVRGDSLIYPRRGRTTALVVRNISLAQTDTLLVLPRKIPFYDPSLALSTDGRRLLVGQRDRREVDLMFVPQFE